MLPRSVYLRSLGLLILLSGVLCSCSASEVQRKLRTPDHYLELDARSEYLKVHYKDGGLSVFSNWKTFDTAKLIIGEGIRYNAAREVTRMGSDTVSYAKIALLETNTVLTGDNGVAMAIFTGGTIGVAIFCLTNPKACFGSCPTFYAWDGNRYTLMAEGFSSSILPSLEDRDIDALYKAIPTSRDFEIRMTNEALETHLIQSADLLVAKRPPGGRILHMTDNSLREGLAFLPPSECIAPEGSILPKVLSLDDSERFSSADSNDLAEKEMIELQFENNPSGRKGLSLGFRQSLLTTYLFYQGLAYLGDSAGAFLAKVDSHPDLQKLMGDPFRGLLGGIEVSMKDRTGRWKQTGEFYEAGPIAHNIQTIALPDSLGDGTNVRLRMTKGMWRINYVSEVILGEEVKPLRIHPSKVMKDSLLDQEALGKLLSGWDHLVSMPGDSWTLHYKLPEDFENYELLLDSKGYYLEWMRKEWLAETNPGMATFMFTMPTLFLQQQAPAFKLVEQSMEYTFWNSRYVRH